MRHAVLGAIIALTALVGPFVQAAEKAEDKPIKALLILGGCCHDYANQQKILADGIAARGNIEVTVAYDPSDKTEHLNPVYENPDWAKGFDVVIHDECSADVKDLKIIDRILKPHREGLPAVVLHCGMHSYRSEGFPEKNTPWFQFTGLATTGHGPHVPLTISFTDTDSPITHGLSGWTTGKEELYNNIRPFLPDSQALATGKQGDDVAVVVWTRTYGDKKTKVFATTLGHANETVADPRYLDLVTRGLLWSVGKLDDKHLKPANASTRAEPAANAPSQLAAAQSTKADHCACE